MSLLFDATRLEEMLRDFYFATNAPVDLLKTDLTSTNVTLYGRKAFCDKIRFTRKGRERCTHDNKLLADACKKTHRPQIEICHAGLVHAMVPVILEDEIVAYLAIGRFKLSQDFPDNNPLSDLPLDCEEMKQDYLDLHENDAKWLDSVISMAKMLASYLVSEKIIKVVKNDNLERARAYIESNLSSNLSIENISKATNISRSVLYRIFSYHHGMTVSEYINLKRVQNAVELLIKTDLSIDEIAQAVGFASATYFVSVFKRIKGLPPLQFRKQKFLTVEKET